MNEVAPTSDVAGVFFLAEDTMQIERQSWRTWLAPVGTPTFLDWSWLTLAAVGMVALVVLLVFFFMI
jgi:hypothetical protein